MLNLLMHDYDTEKSFKVQIFINCTKFGHYNEPLSKFTNPLIFMQ